MILLLSMASCHKDTSSTTTPPDITTGLVVHIPLDGNALESISGNTGTNHNVLPTSDHHGDSARAMLFSSSDSSTINFGILTNASFENNMFTISCWVKVTDTSGTRCILSKRNLTGPFEYSLDNHFDHGSFTLDNWIADATAPVYGVDPLKANAGIILNQWHHITYVADGTKLLVYFDGMLQSGQDVRTGNNIFAKSNTPFILGNGGGFGKNYFFSGSLDEIRIYNRALNAEAVSMLMGL